MQLDIYSANSMARVISMINSAGMSDRLVTIVPEVDLELNVRFTALLKFNYDDYVAFRQRTGRTYSTIEGFRKGIL